MLLNHQAFYVKWYLKVILNNGSANLQFGIYQERSMKLRASVTLEPITVEPIVSRVNKLYSCLPIKVQLNA